ncbi:outer membrane beta-barrel protein [Hymenobacter sp. M29]|uniref:Outer membrane beta-barrel protein n=1 Tax=Hymenobacter mellowenesis TaxID=3063995 RepID=A0ABT9AHN0_9BACT|nr:outer membrane beta-barrel protein [Hymenobacter sp. M29]MDO7849339.1 outer membrane beta-barrel protein [Hymenobacter sp. M29]
MLKTLLFSGLLLAGLVSRAQAQAQVTFGPRVGANLATATFNTLETTVAPGTSYNYSKSSIVAPQIGLVLNMQWDKWAFQPALLFSQQGVKQQASVTADFFGIQLREDITATCRVNYLVLPLNVVYTPGGDHGLQFFAGPYLAVGVGGKANYTISVSGSSPGQPGTTFNESESSSVGFAFGNEFPDFMTSTGGGSGGTGLGSSEASAMARRFDAGVAAGVGYRVGPVQAQLGYSFGLLNVNPDYPASYQMPNQAGTLRSLQLTATYFLSGK